MYVYVVILISLKAHYVSVQLPYFRPVPTLNCTLILPTASRGKQNKKVVTFSTMGILCKWAAFVSLFVFCVCTYEKKKKPSVPDPVRARTTCCFVSLMCFAAANGKTNSRSIFRVFRALHSLCPSDNTRQGHFVHFLLTWFRRCQLSSQSSRTVKSFSIGVNDRRLTVVLFGISWVPRFRSYWFPCFCCGF